MDPIQNDLVALDGHSGGSEARQGEDQLAPDNPPLHLNDLLSAATVNLGQGSEEVIHRHILDLSFDEGIQNCLEFVPGVILDHLLNSTTTLPSWQLLEARANELLAWSKVGFSLSLNRLSPLAHTKSHLHS